jgi:hypothetical protein
VEGGLLEVKLGAGTGTDFLAEGEKSFLAAVETRPVEEKMEGASEESSTTVRSLICGSFACASYSLALNPSKGFTST